jgi:hypothetical protein
MKKNWMEEKAPPFLPLYARVCVSHFLFEKPWKAHDALQAEGSRFSKDEL